MAEYALLDGALFDLPGILAIKKGNESLSIYLSIYLPIPLDVAYIASEAYSANFI